MDRLLVSDVFPFSEQPLPEASGDIILPTNKQVVEFTGLLRETVELGQTSEMMNDAETSHIRLVELYLDDGCATIAVIDDIHSDGSRTPFGTEIHLDGMNPTNPRITRGFLIESEYSERQITGWLQMKAHNAGLLPPEFFVPYETTPSITDEGLWDNSNDLIGPLIVSMVAQRLDDAPSELPKTLPGTAAEQIGRAELLAKITEASHEVADDPQIGGGNLLTSLEEHEANHVTMTASGETIVKVTKFLMRVVEMLDSASRA